MKRSHSDNHLLEWSGKLASAFGVLALVAYVAGFEKFYFLYRSLDCLWVLQFHSFQDFVIHGAIDVVICSIVAIALYFAYPSAIDIDNNGRRIVAFLLSGIFVSITFGVAYFKYTLPFEIYELLIYSATYFFLGVGAAQAARDLTNDGNYRYFMVILLLFVFLAGFSSRLLYVDEDLTSLVEKGKFLDYAYSLEGGNAILIGSVNGKYLIRPCGEDVVFKLVETSDEWAISSTAPKLCIPQ